MSDVARWLDGRRPAMPAELRRAVDAALDAARQAVGAAKVEGNAGAEGDVAERLAQAGLAAVRRAAAAASHRSTAPELLAADALLTYACEAAAEEGTERLDRLTASLAIERFSALLEPHDA